MTPCTAQRASVSHVFHEPSQPLTALLCSRVKISLASDRTSQEFRTSVDAALEDTERLRRVPRTTVSISILAPLTVRPRESVAAMSATTPSC